ncbi:MAG TPA: glutamate racemase [Parachlamydiaceae bacterium]|nr:glutamate racemase [Parachlamydiaceae bacterium]
MKNQEAVGIFDSGIGGLTVMKQIASLLPEENIVYFGDTARVPYGGKSPETIVRYSIENTIFLLEQNIKVLVVACNTASAYAMQKLQKLFNIPVIGVIEPGAEKAVQMTKNKRIAVLGTKGTIQSGVYSQEIKKKAPDSFILPISCPLFVPLVEESFIFHPAAKLIIKEYLAPIKQENIDTILLGCTHYPLLKEMIQQEVGEDVAVVDSASICAETLKNLLLEEKLINYTSLPSSYRYFVSDDPEKFASLGSYFLDSSLKDVSLKKH